ncbi:hypothetical protein MMC22_002304 [Lobaria immixta]|nr:hypothetical protein [Lobaria immixta]
MDRGLRRSGPVSKPKDSRQPDPEDEANTDDYPHTFQSLQTVPRLLYAADHLDEQRWTIALFSAQLCKRHSLVPRRASPAQRVPLLRVRQSWMEMQTLSSGIGDAMYYLKLRAEYFGKSLRDVDIPWRQHPVERLRRRLWAKERLVCPIEGCVRRPWTAQHEKSMRMCLGCNAIIRV